MNVENIVDPFSSVLVATIISGPCGNEPQRTDFVTDPSHSIQVGVLHRQAGTVVEAHQHLPVQKTVSGCQEVLVVRSGTVMVDIYCPEKKLIVTRVLRTGDVFIQYIGGHRFEFASNCQFIELKQGPYSPQDKVYFNPTQHEQMK